MTNIKNEKTALVAIVAIAAVLAISTIAIGNARMALAAETTTVTTHVNNTGVNVQTDTNQKQDCVTAGGYSGIADSCHTSSTDKIDQSGGMLKSSRMPSSTSSTSVSPPAG